MNTDTIKKITYNGLKLNKPSNLSMNCVKDFVDECGKDYCITVQAAIDFLSKKLHKK